MNVGASGSSPLDLLSSLYGGLAQAPASESTFADTLAELSSESMLAANDPTVALTLGQLQADGQSLSELLSPPSPDSLDLPAGPLGTAARFDAYA